MATFPYSPTQILSSPKADDILYLIQPPTSSSQPAQLLALNTTTTLNPTSLPYSTISPTLPFLNGAQSDNAYTTAIDDEGNIFVYTGKCGNTAQDPMLWRFTPSNSGSSINGTWKELGLTLGGLDANENPNGANYLASAIAFSSTQNSTSDMYIFGGMCPNSTSLRADNWTQSANYSNTMLTIEPSGSSSTAAPAYVLGISSSRGPPIAEAGFSITPLQPTFFDSGSINETQSQNQNFVLLGGHTQQAFINMSQVALYLLPEQSWTFISVDSPSPEPNTDLAARGQTAIESRSGHTAVLSSDGKRVFVFGGWVGDVTQPAEPLLAVLELGEGYGGSGDWQWSIPSQTGAGLPLGTGIYGHGASMLPGDVMMVVGGYQIPASGGSRRKRADPSVSSTAYLFNTTSNTWITSYSRPKVSASHTPEKGASADTDSAAKRVGLGAGLTLGILAVIVVIAVYFWYNRHLKRRRAAQEDELRNLAAGAHRLQLSGSSFNGSNPRRNEMATVDWAGDTGPYRLARAEPEAERTGLLFEIPSPTRGLRRSLQTRGVYQPTSRFDDGRRNPGFSTIHPIDERDEYAEDQTDVGPSGQHEVLQRDDYNILGNVPVLNPFIDPLDRSRTPSPQSPQDREHEIRSWVNDWAAAEAIMHQNAGRLSPDKNDRTSSTLSDQSARSGLSGHSNQNSAGGLSRSISQRSAALFGSTPFRSTNDMTSINHQQNAGQQYSPDHRRSQSLSLFPGQRRAATPDTFATAETSFSQMQAEGEALLGRLPDSGEPSPTRSQTRTRGWMGSVRRAFTGAERSASTSPENNASTSSSPVKSHYQEGGIPRRAASAGAMLWQKRQGAKDWDVEGPEQKREGVGAVDRTTNDEEWDVESAVERRVVQVMFTVPKEKLRVVNNGPDGDGESTLSTEMKDAGEGGDEQEKRKDKGKE